MYCTATVAPTGQKVFVELTVEQTYYAGDPDHTETVMATQDSTTSALQVYDVRLCDLAEVEEETLER